MKNRWTDNLVLKISSLGIAFFLWVIVINISNPIITRSQSVPLDVVNADIISEAGKTYSVAGSNTVTVSYEIRTRDEGKVTASDFRAYVDLGDLYDITGAVPVTVEVLNNKNLINGAVTARPGVIRVSTEDMQRKEFTLTTKVRGTPSDGYSVGAVKLDHDTVTVTGPVSIIGQISQVGVEIDVEGRDSDSSGEAELKYFDANGNSFIISDERVTKDINAVGYTLIMLNGRTLKLNFNVGGTVAAGYRFTGAESSTKSIQVLGLPEDLGDLRAVDIPESALSVEGATGDVSVNLDIRNYLPENVRAVGQTEITVVLKVEALNRKAMVLTIDDLTVSGNAGMNVSIVPERITAVISGVDTSLESITNADLGAKLDVSGMEPGENTGSLTFELPAGFSVDSYTPFEVVISDDTSGYSETQGSDENGSVDTGN